MLQKVRGQMRCCRTGKKTLLLQQAGAGRAGESVERFRCGPLVSGRQAEIIQPFGDPPHEVRRERQGGQDLAYGQVRGIALEFIE